jgi:hypothetical protein
MMIKLFMQAEGFVERNEVKSWLRGGMETLGR